MPKDKLTDYSATNASNTDIGGIDIDEGMLPSAVNNALREQMTHLKNFSDGTDAITGLTVAGNVSVDGGTIKLDGNHPTGTGNVALGDTALDASAGDQNTAIGANALTSTTGTQNTAVGYGAGDSTTSGSYNVFVGRLSGDDNTTGNNNTAAGRSSFANNTSGSDCVAIGSSALLNNSTASNNVAVGKDALQQNTTGSGNSSLGFEAMKSATTALNSVMMGYRAGRATTTGSWNSFVGANAGDDNTTGFGNSFFGTNYSGGAGSAITTGSRNTIIGGYTGNQNSLDIRTGTNYIVLSNGDGFPRLTIDTSGNALFRGSQYVFGINSGTYNWYMGTTNNRLEVYDGSGQLRGYLTLAGAWTDTSDTAFKRDISDMTYGITTVKALQPRVYHVAGTTGTDDPQIGFVAQEIEAHVPEVVSGEDGSKGVSYGRLTAVLTKALQEAIAKIETLETKVAALEAE